MLTANDIRFARIKRRWTQKRLAEHAGVGLGSVIRIEKEDVGPGVATFDIVSKILIALDAEIVFTDKAYRNKKNDQI
jgi:transcriptional regulator with XRE-family HTH domain